MWKFIKWVFLDNSTCDPSTPQVRADFDHTLMHSNYSSFIINKLRIFRNTVWCWNNLNETKQCRAFPKLWNWKRKSKLWTVNQNNTWQLMLSGLDSQCTLQKECKRRAPTNKSLASTVKHSSEPNWYNTVCINWINNRNKRMRLSQAMLS